MINSRSFCRTMLLTAVVVGTEIPDATAALPLAYRITDLGTLGGSDSAANGINASGQVAGRSTTIGDEAIHPFLWTPTMPGGTAGTMIDLGTLGGETSVFGVAGWGINDSGQVAGWSYTTGNAEIHAFIYDGTLHDLGTLGGRDSSGHGINASGQVTGYSATTGGLRAAFLWTPTMPNGASGTMIDLGSLGGGATGWTINASGQVAGDSRTNSGDDHAFLYDGTMHDLGTLGGRHSYALAINDSGQVAGYSLTARDADRHAFLWTPATPNGISGTMIDLGKLGGPDGALYGSYANGIDADGHVVGGSFTTGNAARHAFIYSGDSGMVDLNSLIDPLSGWELAHATAINDAGQITGLGSIAGQGHAFLLTPVPEPASLALLAIAFPLLVWRNSRDVGTGGARGVRQFALAAVTSALVVARLDQ